MTYVLYGEDGSGSGIVEMALVAIGSPHEVRKVALGADQQRAAAYASINPQRKLPTLVTPAGETLTESAAILLVLDERHPHARLLPPTGSAERAQALRWLLFVASELYPLVEINDYPTRFAPTPESAPAVQEVARRVWRERWLVVERAIEGSPWLSAGGFSFVDVYIATVSRWAQQGEWRKEHLPKIERIASAVSEREPIAAVWRRHRGL